MDQKMRVFLARSDFLLRFQHTTPLRSHFHASSMFAKRENSVKCGKTITLTDLPHNFEEPEMRDSQIQKMSLRELITLKSRIDDAIAARRIDEREALKKKIETMAERAGFQVKDLFSHGREGSVKSSLAAKYRHPKKHDLIWTGRGRRPNWLIEAGGNIERFRVT